MTSDVESFGDGRYQVVEVLGAGAMGIVYKAFDRVVGRHVAIKTISTAGIPADEVGEFLKMFQAEAQAAGRLDHAGIVTVYDFNPSPDGPYIVMSLVEGGTLSGVMSKRKLLWEEVTDLGVQVAEALEYAHQHGIQAHRDIKPGNIFVTAEGRYKVGDFGVAHMRKTVDEATRSTFFSGGTPRYMAPEQVATPRKVDGRSDLFSLSVVLYEALTGQLPYQGVTLNFDPEEQPEVAQRIVAAAYTRNAPLRKVMPNLPVPLAQAIDCGIHPDPAQRYRSCAEFAHVLRRVHDGLKSATVVHQAPRAPATVVATNKSTAPRVESAPPAQKAFNPLTLMLAGIVVLAVWQLWPRLRPTLESSEKQPGQLVQALSERRHQWQGREGANTAGAAGAAADGDESSEAGEEDEEADGGERDEQELAAADGDDRAWNEKEAKDLNGDFTAVNSDGRSGSYFVPVEAFRREVPLMVLLHGTGGRGRDILRLFEPLAEEYGFAIAAPDSHVSSDGRSEWQVGDDTAADVDHVRTCISELLRMRDIRIERGGRLVAGYSSGGALAAYLGSVDASFSAFAVLHGKVDAKNLGSRHPRGWISTGTDDRSAPVERVRQNTEDMQSDGFSQLEFQEFSGAKLSEEEMTEMVRWWLEK